MNIARLPSTHLTQRRPFSLLAQRVHISELLAALAEAFSRTPIRGPAARPEARSAFRAAALSVNRDGGWSRLSTR